MTSNIGPFVRMDKRQRLGSWESYFFHSFFVLPNGPNPSHSTVDTLCSSSMKHLSFQFLVGLSFLNSTRDTGGFSHVMGVDETEGQCAAKPFM
jgi:hypothetical protein